MRFITAECPHCGKVLQLPDDAEQVVCMFCAKPIDVPAVLNEQTGAEEKEELFAYWMGEAKRLIDNDLIAFRADMRQFTAEKYPPAFDAYTVRIAPVINTYCKAAENGSMVRAAEEFSGFLMDQYLEHFQKEGVKKNDSKFFDYRYTVVAFLVPGMLESRHEAADILADHFLERWNKEYPKNPLGKADFASISRGFKKKLCFITTAVCESLGKGDDCAELNAFRTFRDHWLLAQPEGERKIREYYLFAPMIVERIEQHPEREAIYRSVWQEDLEPCLIALKANRMEDCAEQYEAMVERLEQRFLPC